VKEVVMELMDAMVHLATLDILVSQGLKANKA
jgi:hypothetical protein